MSELICFPYPAEEVARYSFRCGKELQLLHEIGRQMRELRIVCFCETDEVSDAERSRSRSRSDCPVVVRLSLTMAAVATSTTTPSPGPRSQYHISSQKSI